VLLSAGVTNRSNILLMREGAVSARVEALPAVRSCEVRRVFPGRVIIRVEERDPFATLLANNRAFVIDREGVVLEERTLGDPHVEPYITEVPGLGVLRPAERIDLPPLHAAIEMLEAFRQSEVSRSVTVSEVAARSPNDLRMYCDELPFEIRWGRGDYVPQARRLDVLWAHNDGKLSFREYCDLRFENKIACR
jgi:cell division septal protein FtsQ